MASKQGSRMIVGLDIGTSKVVALVGEIGADDDSSASNAASASPVAIACSSVSSADDARAVSNAAR